MSRLMGFVLFVLALFVWYWIAHNGPVAEGQS